MSEGRKDDEGKLRFDLIPPRALILLAKVYTTGAEKYDDRNWEKGMSWSRIYGAIQRHLWKFWNGEKMDEETGVPHLINAAWGCFTLTEYMFTHTELDDRQELRQTWKGFKKKVDEFLDTKKEKVEIYCNSGNWTETTATREDVLNDEGIDDSGYSDGYEYYYDDHKPVYRIKKEVE